MSESSSERSKQQELETALAALARVTFKQIEEHPEFELGAKEEYLTYRVQVTNLKYPDKGVDGFNSSSEPRIHTRPALMAAMRLLTEVEAQPEYRAAVELLDGSAAKGSIGPTFVVQRFVHAVAVLSLPEALDLSRTLAAEAFSLRKWRATAFLVGVVPPITALVISPHNTLRRVIADDLGYEAAAELLAYGRAAPGPWGKGTPSAILEVTLEAGRQTDINAIVSRIEFALRLLRRASVIELRREMHTSSLLDSGSITWDYGGQTNPAYTAKLEPNDAGAIGRIAAILDGPSPHPEVATALRIARGHFDAGLLKGGSPESMVASAVAGLEALFSDSNQDLKRALSQRVTLALALLGAVPADLHSGLREAYDIRSRFSHGSTQKLPPDRISGAAALTLDCLRAALLMFHQLPASLDRDAFLREIDLALLDPAKRDELRVTLRAQVFTAIPFAAPPAAHG